MNSTIYLDRKNKLICGLDPGQVGQMIDELMAAEIGGEIDVVGPDDAHRLKHPPEECGLSCQINRVFLGLGNDLDQYEWERQQLERGQAIVAVPAPSAEAQAKVREIMTGHCQTSLHFSGTWTSRSL
ncbi:MAG: hypothetical protein KC438_04815 [Thermomicrobiales bacterium]|nr:hypothetical protein [Thermomicrobiales bacterium]